METNTKKRLAKTPAAEEFGEVGEGVTGEEVVVGDWAVAERGEAPGTVVVDDGAVEERGEAPGVVVVGDGAVDEGGEAPGVAATVMANFRPFWQCWSMVQM